jgi:hypothetical protein
MKWRFLKKKDVSFIIKEKEKVFFFPWARRRQGKKRLSCSPATPLFPSLSALTCPKIHDTTHTHTHLLS